MSEMSEYDHGVVNFALSQLEAGSNNMFARKVVHIAKFQKQVKRFVQHSWYHGKTF